MPASQAEGGPQTATPSGSVASAVPWPYTAAEIEQLVVDIASVVG